MSTSANDKYPFSRQHPRTESDAYEKTVEIPPQQPWVTELPEHVVATSGHETAAYWYQEAQHQKGKQGSLARSVKEMADEAEARTEELEELKVYVRALHDVETSLRDQLRKEEAKTAEFIAMLREAAPAAFTAGTSEIDAARHVVQTVRDATKAFVPVLANMWTALEGNLRAAGFDIDKFMKGRP